MVQDDPKLLGDNGEVPIFIVENGMVSSSIPIVKSSPYLTDKILARYVGSQEPTHRKVGSKPHPTSRGFLSRVGPTG